MMLIKQCTEQDLVVAPVERSQELFLHVSWWGIISSLQQGEN